MSDKEVELKINVRDEEDSQESEVLFGENSLWTSDPRVEIKRDITDNIEPTTLKRH